VYVEPKPKYDELKTTTLRDLTHGRKAGGRRILGEYDVVGKVFLCCHVSSFADASSSCICLARSHSKKTCTNLNACMHLFSQQPIAASQSVFSALTRMAEAGTHHLCVSDDNGKVIDMVSQSKLIEFLTKHMTPQMSASRVSDLRPYTFLAQIDSTAKAAVSFT
jgi:hypothetical protein